MAAHRKFTFDDPEDSYWNANGPVNGETFVDTPSASNAAAARAALDDLFDRHVRFDNDDDLVNATSEFSQNGFFESKKRDKPVTKDSIAISSVHGTLPWRTGDVSTNTKPDLACIVKPLNKTERPFDRNFSSKSVTSVVSDGSVGSVSSEATTQLDYSRLKSEHRKLQKYLEQVRLDRFRAAEAEMTISRLRKGEPVTFDLYRSKQKKMELLDAALDSYDGNVITAVVVFLEKSLSMAVFIEILLEKPIAANHYVAYLSESEHFDQLITILNALDRSDEAAMVQFSLACRKLPEERVQQLKKCVEAFTSPSFSSYSKAVTECIDLLERQIAIEDADEKIIKAGASEVFQQFPKTATLIARPVLTTLYYTCLYHYDLPANAYSSPLSIRQVFQITEKQFTWMAVCALGRLKRWNDIEKLLSSKKLLGGTRLICPFSWRCFFQLISLFDSPPKEILCRLLRAVPDVAERQLIARQYPDASEVVVECLVSQKDRVALTSFLAKLTPNTSEATKALSALSGAANKWKN